jgi:hypothetical protein
LNKPRNVLTAKGNDSIVLMQKLEQAQPACHVKARVHPKPVAPPRARVENSVRAIQKTVVSVTQAAALVAVFAVENR